MEFKKHSITAVIPTRGDVDCGLIFDRLRKYSEIGEIRFVLGSTPFNRYANMMASSGEYFFTQDDDCLTDLQPLIDCYEPLFVTNAMTPEHAARYAGRQTLIGFGALFNRANLGCFRDYPWERDALFYRESDRIFATVNRHKTVFPDIEILAHAHNDNRLWKQKDHVSAMHAMNKRILEVTGIAA
jgi:hypothetical protein